MFECIFLIPILAQDPKIYFQSFTSQDFTTRWTIQNNNVNIISDCGSSHLIGGYNLFGANAIAMTTIQLPPHTHVEITFTVWIIDSWDKEFLYVYLDQTLFQFGPYQGIWNIGDICGASYWSWSDSQQKINIMMPHSLQSIEIRITSNLDYLPYDESWGFRDFQLFLCNYCSDDNIVPFDGCFNNQYSCVIGCLNCIQGICLYCEVGWELDTSDNSCVQIKNDGLLVIGEECDDLLNINRCKNGKFKCPQYCLICSFGYCQKCDNFYYLIENKCLQEPLYYLDNSIQIIYPPQFAIVEQSSKFEIVEDFYLFEQIQRQEKDVIFELICDQGCLKCRFGLCYLCQDDWDLVNFQCIKKCRNESIFFINYCSSQKMISQIDLQKCKNYLIEFYPALTIGKGLYLNQNNECGQFCLNNQQQIYFLQLSNNIKQNFQECQLKCTQYCQICKLGLCYQCQPSFYLIDQECYSVCGDGLVAYGQEQCDDMNDVEYDGCYKCLFQCKLNCKQCVQGICYDDCEYGYYLINEGCYSICGDGIKSDVEDCDDQNDIKEDGCYQCKYYCPITCDTCENGKCQECKNGYKLTQNNNTCQSICGDGMAVTQEECDDYNQLNGDGCSSLCEIEDNYICLNQIYSFTQCISLDQPEMILTYFEEKEDKQYVSLKFSQKVKSDNINYQTEIQTSLSNINDNYYTIQITAILEVKMEVSDVEYRIEISFNQLIDAYPELDVILLKPLYNEYNLEVQNYEQKIQLRKPRYIDSFLQYSSDALTKVNKATTNSLGIIAIIVIIFRNSLIFSDIINLLQQQSYLRFVNTKWPFNLEQYFSSILADVIQVILSHLKIWGIFLLGFYENFTESYQKFKFYGINADFLTNIESQLFQVFFLLLVYLFSKFILFTIKLLNEKQFIWIGQKATLLLLYKQKWCQNNLKGYNMQMLKSFVKVNSYDLFFTCFLSLTSGQNKFRIIWPIVILSIYILYIFSQYVTFLKRKPILIPKNNHELIALCKKLLFIIILVLLQDSQILQTILLGMLTTVYLIYLKFEEAEKQELMNIYLLEINSLFFLTTSAVYWDDFAEYISYENQVKIAWCQIGFMLFTNLVNLIKYVKIISVKFLEKINSKQSKVIEKNINNQTFFTFQKG